MKENSLRAYSLRALREIFFAWLKEGGSRKARQGVARFAKGVSGRCTEHVEVSRTCMQVKNHSVV